MEFYKIRKIIILNIIIGIKYMYIIVTVPYIKVIEKTLGKLMVEIFILEDWLVVMLHLII